LRGGQIRPPHGGAPHPPHGQHRRRPSLSSLSLRTWIRPVREPPPYSPHHIWWRPASSRVGPAPQRRRHARLYGWARRAHRWARRAHPGFSLFSFFILLTEAGINPPWKRSH
jgi:hypothetical protein